MELIHKAPAPEIKIYNYDSPDTPVIVFSPRATDNTQLLSYSFSESTNDLFGSFSFNIAGGDNNLFDKIHPLQIVKIYEQGINPVFIGILSSKQISCAMTTSGVMRTIEFSGTSITGLIANFQLVLDIRYLDVLKIGKMPADAVNKMLIERLQANELLKIQDFLKITWEYYLECAGVYSDGLASSNIVVYKIINSFLGKDFFEVGKAASIPIPIANTFINQGINTCLQMWQCILAPPIYEIFSRMNANGKTKIVVREAPFDSDVWSDPRYCPCKKIVPEKLISYGMQMSNTEVYTAFLADIAGAPVSADKLLQEQMAKAAKDNVKILQINKPKFNIYGARLCEVTFRGYEKNKQGYETTERAMQKLATRLKHWFGRLDEMLLARATLINDFPQNYNDGIHAGERVSFLGGEFYVNSVAHTWSYGDAPKIDLQLSRGGRYDKKGNFLGSLENMGTSRIELIASEQDTANSRSNNITPELLSLNR